MKTWRLRITARISPDVELTVLDRLDSTSACQRIGPDDTDEDGHGHHANPPRGDVSDKVDLLLLVILCPEADSTHQERPAER